MVVKKIKDLGQFNMGKMLLICSLVCLLSSRAQLGVGVDEQSFERKCYITGSFNFPVSLYQSILRDIF